MQMDKSENSKNTNGGTAAYHALAPSSRRKRLLCPLWPNERGVDLAVFDHGGESVPSQALLAGTAVRHPRRR